MLNVLLSHALLDLTRAVERRGDDVNVVRWANLLRLVGDGGVPRKELHLRARVSKRAMRTMVDGLVKHGWLVDDDGLVRVVDPGRRARDTWARLVEEAESGWVDDGGRLRSALEALVGRLDLELPWYPIGYGTADVSIDGSVYANGHGVDWKPVVRSDLDSVTGLPLLALLSQALVAFALDYEAKRRGALVRPDGHEGLRGVARALRRCPRRRRRHRPRGGRRARRHRRLSRRLVAVCIA